MKLAIFGGTFNPIHNGHLAIADDVCKTLSYEKVLFVPSFIPPHKTIVTQNSTEHRLKMLELACEGERRFCVEKCELERKGVSYTIDTVKFVIEKYKLDTKPGLIIGQENAAEFDKWKSPAEIAKLCDIIIVSRPRVSIKEDVGIINESKGLYTGGFEIADYNEVVRNFKYDAISLNNFSLPISSTLIRSLCKNKNGFKYLVPQKVFEYIEENSLYIE